MTFYNCPIDGVSAKEGTSIRAPTRTGLARRSFGVYSAPRQTFASKKRLGEGQFYLLGMEDKDGKPLDGSKTYRLNVPTNAPIRQYWSATLYDRDTHALIRKMSHAARSSQSQGLQVNQDGSVDLYFGPKAPEGKESNWTPTDPQATFEILFRFYGPLPSLFDKTWVLPDVELVK